MGLQENLSRIIWQIHYCSFRVWADEMVEKINKYESGEHEPVDRADFIQRFKRKAINENMATSIIDLLN